MPIHSLVANLYGGVYQQHQEEEVTVNPSSGPGGFHHHNQQQLVLLQQQQRRWQEPQQQEQGGSQNRQKKVEGSCHHYRHRHHQQQRQQEQEPQQKQQGGSQHHQKHTSSSQGRCHHHRHQFQQQQQQQQELQDQDFRALPQGLSQIFTLPLRPPRGPSNQLLPSYCDAQSMGICSSRHGDRQDESRTVMSVGEPTRNREPLPPSYDQTVRKDEESRKGQESNPCNPPSYEDVLAGSESGEVEGRVEAESPRQAGEEKEPTDCESFTIMNSPV